MVQLSFENMPFGRWNITPNVHDTITYHEECRPRAFQCGQ